MKFTFTVTGTALDGTTREKTETLDINSPDPSAAAVMGQAQLARAYAIAWIDGTGMDDQWTITPAAQFKKITIRRSAVVLTDLPVLQ